MTKKTLQTNNTDLQEIPEVTPEMAMAFLSDHMSFQENPDELFKQAASTLQKKIEGKELSKKDDEIFQQAANALYLEKGLGILEGVEEQKKTALLKLYNDLQQEFEIKTASEKSLLHILLNAYARTLKITKKLYGAIEGSQYITSERNQYISILSKELDRANRHYTSTLQTLIGLKRPAMTFQVHANTALLGTNNQVNHYE